MKFLRWLYEFVFGPRHDPQPPVALLAQPIREAQQSARRAFDRFDQTMSFIAQQAAEDGIDPEPSFIGRVNAEVGMVEQQIREHRK